MKPDIIRCAIYTRKSTEEGLEMEFNSLQAQREACEAYISSQKNEGWILIKTHYDDGGFSGGNMERPALKKLMQDIQNHEIDVIVVYKIDRLTRSLMDFAKLVEVFDKNKVTFVSVTQSFNTTNSMGRLTLNVLLSFAQFEREVTSERIRDKISASKKKGIWMGGNLPIGYKVVERKLLFDEEYVPTVKHIFDKYLELKSVTLLKEYLDDNGYRTRLWVSKKGVSHPSANFSRGILYKILSNPIYAGKIRHKNELYDGQHRAIIKLEQWEAVQNLLVQNTRCAKGHKKEISGGKLLKGKLFDVNDTPYSPSYTIKNNMRYHYYLSQNKLQNKVKLDNIIQRIPAREFEDLIYIEMVEKLSAPEFIANIATDIEFENLIFEYLNNLRSQINSRELIYDLIEKVVIGEFLISIEISNERLAKYISDALGIDVGQIQNAKHRFEIPYINKRSRTGTMLLNPIKPSVRKDPFNIPAHDLNKWIKGTAWREDHFKGMTLNAIAQREGVSAIYITRLIKFAFDMTLQII